VAAAAAAVALAVVIISVAGTGNVRLGIAEQEALLKAFEDISTKMGEADADLDKLLDEQSKLQVC